MVCWYVLSCVCVFVSMCCLILCNNNRWCSTCWDDVTEEEEHEHEAEDVDGISD